MFQAQYLFGGTTLFSPWMSRQGDNLTLTVDFIEQATSTLGVTVFQKNSQDTGNGTAHPDGVLTMANTTASNTKTFTGLEELVRFQFATTGSGANYALFRMLPNLWFNDVKPS